MGYRTHTCPVARDCGGCEWLAVPYPIQLRRKREAVEREFEGLTSGLDAPIEILGMDEPVAYRHKCASPFAPGPKGSIRSGFYARGSHRIVACERCLTEDSRGREALGALVRATRAVGMRAYDEDRGRGLLRHGVVRLAHSSRDALLVVVTNGQDIPKRGEFVARIREEAPFVTSIVQNVNQRPGNAILGRQDRTLLGPGYVEDELLGVRFRIGPRSFYQTNPAQTEVLYRRALGLAELRAGERLLDAYCGIGTIGLIAASRTEGLEVVGVEDVDDAVRNARANARINGLERQARLELADATRYARRAAAQGERFDVVVLDPPRAGATPEFLSATAALGPSRIVYISCNPATQRRDTELLVKLSYELTHLNVVDMFPHTKHAETVALLRRVG